MAATGDGTSLKKRKDDGGNLSGKLNKKTTTVQVQGSSDDHYEINIKTPSGKIISIKVKGSDTIGSLKLKIHAEEHIPFEQQELFFNGMVLENINTLANLQIVKESTLTVMQKSVGLMEIFVNTFYGKTIALSVKPMDTIAEVKSVVESKEHIPCVEQVLVFNNMVLGDDATLFDFDINTKATLTLMRVSSGSMHIAIRKLTGRIIDLDVKRSDTIYRVKVKIYNKEGLRPCEQRLIWNGRQLEDSPTLADYHIPNESIIHLVERLRGC